METAKLESGWAKLLKDEFSKPYMGKLKSFLDAEYASAKTIYPARENIFAALNHTPFDKVKVVIIGQDPYHGENQAHGLCFSVLKGVKIPPSLQNIYKELKTDLNIEPPAHGLLTDWAKQGVLLLNATLTVEASKPGSHQNKGWELFTDRVVELLNQEKTGIVFVLWGSYAQKKCATIDQTKHFVISAAHHSPFSCYRGFFGHRPFSQINGHLAKMSRDPICFEISS